MGDNNKSKKKNNLVVFIVTFQEGKRSVFYFLFFNLSFKLKCIFLAVIMLQLQPVQ